MFNCLLECMAGVRDTCMNKGAAVYVYTPYIHTYIHTYIHIRSWKVVNKLICCCNTNNCDHLAYSHWVFSHVACLMIHYHGDQVSLPWRPSANTMGYIKWRATSVCLGEKYQTMCPKCACEVNAVNCCMCACGGCARHMCARHAGPSIIAFSVLYHHGRSMRTAIYMYGTV